MALPLIPWDKSNHIIDSVALFALGSVVSNAFGFDQAHQIAHGASFSLTVGALKELVYDKWLGKGTASWGDFGADVVGVLIGVICRWQF